ncbi:hypothetical protein D0Z00_002333 [Geotrichum galactomycetum]|uniref:Uncharacterized protein n=1 Tax=Geotrichum galactomycetum TaxID=27317 RepID=A0ACB6V4H1_9ASCO|nr:hypothetical protein D0Z00_002333 [Geotrichum candidum]
MYQQDHIDINDPKVQKRLRTKYNLIRELVETEETFNLDLNIISDVYANTLIKPPYLHYASGRDVMALFSNVEQILVLSPLKRGLDKMQETANKINALEPDNMYVYQRKMDSLYDEDDSYNDDGTVLTKVDYNTAMSRLKDFPRIDEELELLIIQFDRKHRHVKNLIKYLRENIMQIQNHFDVNSSFAHAWSTWGEDDSKRSKIYTKFALFCRPFTTFSSAHVSTNSLLDQIEANVLSPLQKMYEYYHQASNTILLHDRTHAAYQRYTEWRVVAEGSHDQPELPAEVLVDADAFMLAHNLLKIELPELFSGTERVIDASLVRFLSIQRDWFRFAVDSTSNVFGLTLDDIRATTRDPIVDAFARHQSRVARALVDEKLRICHTLESTSTGFDGVTLVESSQQSQHSSHHLQPQQSHLSQHKEYQMQQQAQQVQYAQQVPRQHTLTTVKSLQLTAVPSSSSLSSASQDSESIKSATTPTTPQHKRRSMILNWPIRKNTIRK